MRTVSKDIMMICKGWYINRQNISKRQAVENYIKEYLECEPYSDCVIDILYNAVMKIHGPDALLAKHLVEESHGRNRNLSVTDFMIQSLIYMLEFKVTLKMDLSDYKAIQKYVNNEFTTVCLLGECKPWWIFYKNDKIEDDLE